MDMTVGGAYKATEDQLRQQLEANKKRLAASRAKNGAGKKRKKGVGYNAKEVAAMLMRAARPAGVSQVMIRVSGEIERMQRCASMGEYDEAELRAAIAHAKRIMKCAKKKKLHLQEEERMEHMGRKKNSFARTGRERKAKQLLCQELKKRRRRHRREEKQEVDDAMIRYLRERANAAERAEAASEAAMEGATDVSGISAADAGGAVDVAADAGVTVDVCM